MNCMIKFDGSGIADVLTNNRELRVAILDTANTGRNRYQATICMQIGMTFRTALIARRRKVDGAAMFGVASGAVGCRDLRRMMSWAVVAGEAGAVGSFCRKDTSLLNVAGGTFFFENRVGLRETTGTIHAGIVG